LGRAKAVINGVCFWVIALYVVAGTSLWSKEGKRSSKGQQGATFALWKS